MIQGVFIRQDIPRVERFNVTLDQKNSLKGQFFEIEIYT